MKMHRILAEATTEIIKSVFRDKRVLDHELASAFERNRKWGKRDRAFIAETVFEVVRWRRALSFLAGSEQTKAICVAQWLRMGYEIPDWWEFDGNEVDTIRSRESELENQPRAVRESIPDWLDTLGEAELGDAWAAELSALNQRAPVFLRANTLRTTREDAIAWLADAGVAASAVEGLPDAIVLAPGKTLPKPMRLDGRVEIQDAGSQVIAPMLDPQAGERVIDACAGGGGKTLHLAALMGGRGRIYAMDIHAKKLSELEQRAKRAKASGCIKTVPITRTTAADFSKMSDRLLIDSPCSGLGTLKRQPDLKWRLKLVGLDRVRATQKELLSSYSAMLKPGGRLVYATCSVLPSENRAAVDHLLEEGGFSLIGERQISPAASGFDGFYAAALLKA